MARINLSFKQTSKDMKIYTAIKNMEEQSDFIKDAITFYIRSLEESKI